MKIQLAVGAFCITFHVTSGINLRRGSVDPIIVNPIRPAFVDPVIVNPLASGTSAKPAVKPSHCDPHASDSAGCLSSKRCGTTVCKWKCAEKSCDKKCTPKCKAPRCQTRCLGKASVSTNMCKMTCDKPQCAVICPNECDQSSGCPGMCTTQCGTPVCKLACNDTLACKQVCENPICDWNCTAPDKESPECKKPECILTCETHKDCQGTNTYKDMPPIQSNEIVVDSFGANLTMKKSLIHVKVMVGSTALSKGEVTDVHSANDTVALVNGDIKMLRSDIDVSEA